MGTQLNVLDAKITDRHHDTEGTHYTIVPTLVVVEPDYLIDISAIAACFKDYGHHPLQYVIDRMKPRANSQAILLGHFAGQALDDIVNKGDDFRFADTLNKSFADHVLNYCTCKGFVPSSSVHRHTEVWHSDLTVYAPSSADAIPSGTTSHSLRTIRAAT